MKKSFDLEEQKIQNQFDRLCKKALKGEQIDYIRHLCYRQKHEKLFSELSIEEKMQLSAEDNYHDDCCNFQVLGFEIEVSDSLIGEALNALTARKRDIILLSYFLEMSDAEIARKMNVVRCTIYEHRQTSLRLMKEFMEEQNEK